MLSASTPTSTQHAFAQTQKMRQVNLNNDY